MSLRNVLAELQKSYLESFPAKTATIQALWSEGRYDDLHTEFHKLKGTGRTYGLPEVSQLGGALETICETDRDALPVCVPLFLKVFNLILDARLKGQVHDLGSDRDFQALIEIVLAASTRARPQGA